VVGLKLMLKNYGERKLFRLKMRKNCFASKTVTKDLADRTAQK